MSDNDTSKAEESEEEVKADAADAVEEQSAEVEAPAATEESEAVEAKEEEVVA